VALICQARWMMLVAQVLIWPRCVPVATVAFGSLAASGDAVFRFSTNYPGSNHLDKILAPLRAISVEARAAIATIPQR
jgi:hypothetical protein